MACACLKNDYNVVIGNSGCDYLTYEDKSIWMSDTGYEKPSTYEVIIHTPKEESYTFSLYISSLNLIPSSELGYTCLEDGIYCFETDSCGKVYKISRAYLCQAYCKLDEALKDATTDEDWEVIHEIEDLILKTESLAENNKPDKANASLSLLNDLINTLECCP